MEKSRLIKYKMIGRLKTGTGLYDFTIPFINGKQKFVRIIIKKLNMNEE